MNQGETMPTETKKKPVKTKVVPKKWEINQDDYIELLESIHPKEAEILLQMKDKKLKCNGLTYNLVKETFPKLIT